MSNSLMYFIEDDQSQCYTKSRAGKIYEKDHQNGCCQMVKKFTKKFENGSQTDGNEKILNLNKEEKLAKVDHGQLMTSECLRKNINFPQQAMNVKAIKVRKLFPHTYMELR